MQRGQVGQPRPEPVSRTDAAGDHDADVGDQRGEGQAAQHGAGDRQVGEAWHAAHRTNRAGGDTGDTGVGGVDHRVSGLQVAGELRNVGVVKTLAESAAGGSARRVDRPYPRPGRRRCCWSSGAATAAELGAALGLSPAAIRRHLDAMLADGDVTAREQHVRGQRGPGPPGQGVRAHRRRPAALRAAHLRRPGHRRAALDRPPGRRAPRSRRSPPTRSAALEAALPGRDHGAGRVTTRSPGPRRSPGR